MEFSNKDKLLITLLTDIYKHLGIEDGVDPEFVQRAVNEGQGWALEWKYPGIFPDSGPAPDHVKYVADVLDLWDLLALSHEQLNSAERADLAQRMGRLGASVSFPGFDGNREPEFGNVANIFVNDLDRWSRFKAAIPNSHMPTTEMYERMLAELAAVRSESQSYEPLNVDEIARVLNSRRHPSSI